MPSVHVRSTLLCRCDVGATDSRRAASVTCDCCSASAHPTMPPPVWLQTFCSPSSLLLCGCLSLESAPHHAIHLLRTPRLTILPCIPNISSFAPAPPPLPFSHRSAPSSHCSNLLAQCCSAVQCSLVQVKQPVAAGSNVTARSATAVRSLKRQLVIAPRCRPGCLWPG